MNLNSDDPEMKGAVVRTFRTNCHPERNGRKPVYGEAEYTATFPLEDGSFLRVCMGEPGFQNHTNLMMLMLTNSPSQDDKSTP